MNSHNKITIGLIHALEESEEPIKQSFQNVSTKQTIYIVEGEKMYENTLTLNDH